MEGFSTEHARYPSESPWKRGRDEVFVPLGAYRSIKKNHIGEEFDAHKYVNMDIDIQTKRAALKHSAAVVSLVCSVAGERIFITTGVVIGSTKADDGFSNSILTSASLLTRKHNMKIDVYLFDKSVYEGFLIAYDIHYNLALIHIQTEAQLHVAPLRPVNDSIGVGPKRNQPRFQMRAHSDSINLSPGDTVVAIGRNYHYSSLMVAPGVLSIDKCGFDCKELMRATCKISKDGIGGPLVNSTGEVIGINFYHESFTPFLAISIVCKCLEQFNKHGKLCSPWLGMEVTNLFVAKTYLLEYVNQKFPNTSTGVIVEKVVPGSQADNAGLLSDDIIVACDGSTILGFLDFFCKVWDKTNREPMNLVIIREGSSEFLKKDMLVEEASQNKWNSWPLPKESRAHVQRTRKAGRS